MTKPTKKKPTKKYEMKRSDIVEAIERFVERLSDIDPHDTSANALEEDLSEIRAELDELTYRISDEQY
jgi:DNA repair ATPase RecN